MSDDRLYAYKSPEQLALMRAVHLERRARWRRIGFVALWLAVAFVACRALGIAQVRAVAIAAPELLTYRVGVVGDNQSGPATFGTICRQLATERVDLFVHLGDAIQNAGTPAEWLDLWAQPLAPIAQVPRIGCRGNHDDPAGWQAFVFPLAAPGGGNWGSFTLAGVRWLVLDANEETFDLRVSMDPGGAQRRFVDAELASPEWRAARWRVALWHQPAVTSLWYTSQACYYQFYAQPQWIALMDRLAGAGCNLVANGHAHGLQMGAWPTATSPMLWVVSGGGGGALDGNCAPLPMLPVALAVHHYCVLEVGPAALVVQAKRVDGSLIAEVRR
jgi:hypothetical protein